VDVPHDRGAGAGMVTPMLRSSLLDRHGLAHGFSTRVGGVSEGPYASLNLGRTVGDVPAAVAENGRRFLAALGADEARFYEVSQVHGRSIVVVAPGDEVARIREREADARVA